jgi:O-antigen/teichoic acid export membrane protein
MKKDFFSFLRRKFVVDFFYSASGNIGVAVISALGGILAARLLGPEGRGELATAIVWVGMLSTIGQIALPDSIIYHMAKEPEKKDAIIQSALVILFFQSILIIGFGSLAVIFFLGNFQPNAVRSVLIFIWIVPAALLKTYLTTSFQGLKKFGALGVLKVLSASILFVSVIIGFILDIKEAEIILVMILVTQYLVAFGALVWTSKNLFSFKKQWDVSKITSLLNYGRKSYLNSLSLIANARLDQFALSLVVPLHQLGIYAVAVSYAGVLYPVLGSFANVLFPHVTGLSMHQAIRKIWRVLIISLVSGAVGAFILAAMSSRLIPLLFGAGFSDSVYPAVILLLGTVILGGNYVLGDGFRGIGNPVIPSVAQILGLSMTIIALYLLLGRFGIMGAAWASLLSYTSVFLFFIAALVYLQTYNDRAKQYPLNVNSKQK